MMNHRYMVLKDRRLLDQAIALTRYEPALQDTIREVKRTGKIQPKPEGPGRLKGSTPVVFDGKKYRSIKEACDDIGVAYKRVLVRTAAGLSANYALKQEVMMSRARERMRARKNDEI